MKINQYKFAEYERKQYEQRGECGRSVTDAFTHLQRFMDMRLLRHAPNLEEIEYHELRALFAKVRETPETIECYVPEPFAVVKRVKPFHMLTAKESALVKQKIVQHIQFLRNIAKRIYESKTANSDQRALASFFYNPQNVNGKKLGVMLSFPGWDAVYLINNVPVIALPGYKNANFVSNNEFLCEYISDDLDELTCQSKELRIVDHRHYKDYCFTYMKQRERAERNIADADLRDAENETATFEAYTDEEEAKGRNEADENKAPGAEAANEYIDEVNYKQQKFAQSSDSNSNNDSAKASATANASGSYDKSNANNGQSGGDGDQDNSDYGSNSSKFGDASRFWGSGNSADEWSNRDHLGAQEEDDDASTEGTDQARAAKNTENQEDFDFDDLGKKSERTEKVVEEEHVETVKESEQSFGVFCKKHKWCLLGAFIGVILLALFITFLLLMLFRPQVLGMDPNNPITALNPFQSAPAAVAPNQGGVANGDVGGNNGSLPAGGAGVAGPANGLPGSSSVAPSDNAPMPAVPAMPVPTSTPTQKMPSDAGEGQGDDQGDRGATDNGSQDNKVDLNTGSAPEEGPIEPIPEEVIKNALPQEEQEAKKKPAKNRLPRAAARTDDFSIYFSDFALRQDSGTVKVTLFKKNTENLNNKEELMCEINMKYTTVSEKQVDTDNGKNPNSKKWFAFYSTLSDQEIMKKCNLLFKHVRCKPTLGRSDCAIFFNSTGLSLLVDLKHSLDTEEASGDNGANDQVTGSMDAN